jgi:hypothetical protein
MAATATYSPDEFVTREAGTLHRLPLERATPKQHILGVSFSSAEGRRWQAVGGGDTVAAAIEWARDCCPDDTMWELEDCNDLYGD